VIYDLHKIHGFISEANSHSGSQEMSFVLWYQKLHTMLNESATSPVLSQMYPVHTFPLCFPDVHFDIIFASMPGSSKWSLPFTVSKIDCVHNKWFKLT
jgi:hypothetical protein